jgi:hypothetical protein
MTKSAGPRNAVGKVFGVIQDWRPLPPEMAANFFALSAKKNGGLAGRRFRICSPSP